jgi:hypothetical protein
MSNKAHLTAISRKSLSAPMKWMESEGFFDGVPRRHCLDYGCGRGFDADALGFQKYDPFWFKCDDFSESEFDVITCNYVLNVIEDFKDRQAAVEQMLHWLAPCGNLFIAVRADKENLKGYTKRGTWQGYIVLAHPLIRSTSAYDLYQLTK